MTGSRQKQLAAAAMVLGVLLSVVGLVGAVLDGDDAAVAATTASSPTSIAAPAATAAPATTAPATTTAAPTFSSTSSTTATTVAGETVEEFAVAFADALARGDADFLFDRLHPVVLAIYDEASCRETVTTRVLPVTDYRLTGPVTGPNPTEFTVGEETVSVPELFRAPVTFGFRGTDVETEGVFAPLDGEIRWFTDCT